MIIQIVILIYWFGVLPYLIGCMVHAIAGRNGMSSYLRGYIWWFGIFAVVGGICKLIWTDVDTYAMVMIGVAVILGIVAAIVGRKVAIHPFGKDDADADKNENSRRRIDAIDILILLAEIGLIGLSIVLLKPHWSDMTEEYLYTVHSTHAAGRLSTMFYAVPIEFIGVNRQMAIRAVTPIFLLPLFYQAYRYLAKGRRFFLVLVYMLYLVQLVAMNYQGMAILQSPWNPVAIGVSVLLPVMYVEIYGVVSRSKIYKRYVSKGNDSILPDDSSTPEEKEDDGGSDRFSVRKVFVNHIEILPIIIALFMLLPYERVAEFTYDSFFYIGNVFYMAYTQLHTNMYLAVIAAVYLYIRQKRGDMPRDIAMFFFLTTAAVTIPGVSYVVQRIAMVPFDRSIYELFPIAFVVGEAGCEVYRRVTEEREELFGQIGQGTIPEEAGEKLSAEEPTEKLLTKARRRIWWRWVSIPCFLVFIIAAGVTLPTDFGTFNITRHKSFTGITAETQNVVNALHENLGEGDLNVVLPLDLQQEVGIADTGITCPYVDWHSYEEDQSWEFVALARRDSIAYIVQPIYYIDETTYNGNGYSRVVDVERYVLFRNVLLEIGK